MYFTVDFVVVGNQVLTKDTSKRQIVVAQLDSEQAAKELADKLNATMKKSLQDITEATETTTTQYKVLPLDTRFNWGTLSMPVFNEDCPETAVYMEFDDGFHQVIPITKQIAKDLVTGKRIKVRDLKDKHYYGDPIESAGDDKKSVESDVYCTLDAVVVDEGYGKEIHIRSTKHNCDCQHSTIASAKLEHISITELDKLINQLQQIRNSM